MKTASEIKADALCGFKADKDFHRCEDCRKDLPAGTSIYWFSDGGVEPRDGTYVGPCCVDKWIGAHHD